jgi:hypothetical protein
MTAVRRFLWRKSTIAVLLLIGLALALDTSGSVSRRGAGKSHVVATTMVPRPPSTSVTTRAPVTTQAPSTTGASPSTRPPVEPTTSSPRPPTSTVTTRLPTSVPPPVNPHSTGTVFPGTACPAFPADDVWNTPITGLPVNPNTATWLASMDSPTTLLHPDFGPSGTSQPYGIPWQIVSPTQPLISISFTYVSESDPGPYPLSASTPIEQGSDRHALMVNPATCTLYELYDAYYDPNGNSSAGSGAIWNLNSDALRPDSWTSADAAGLPILPGLVNYDEAASGSMDHAIRFTAQCTDTSYIWPARHQAGQNDPSCPPMGARFRLNAGFSLSPSQCSAMCQTVLTTMKTYGLILADNGSNWYFQGTADTRWSYTDVDQLKQIPASAFVAVDESCLMVSPNSGQALQPGTSQYAARCG